MTIEQAIRTMVCATAMLFVSVSVALPSQQRQTLTAVEDRPLAKDFSLTDADGTVHRLSQYRGHVVLVNFWATWCPPCLREMPSMQRLWEQLKDRDFVLLAVDVGEDEETVFGFTLSLDVPIEFPLLLDRQGNIVAEWPVRGLPTTFLVDRNGRIVYRAVGGREWDAPELVEAIRVLLHE